MSEAASNSQDTHSDRPIDWLDLKFAVFVGIIAMLGKLLTHFKSEWFHNFNDGLVPFLLVVAYMIARARREPEKLDEWGITTPLTKPAIAVAFLLLAVAVFFQAAFALPLTGKLTFEPWYVPDMIEYILGAFPQQFFMCSVGLVSLAKLPFFRGAWRLPLTVGLVFSLAHWWTPTPFPGTDIPLQMVTTFPAGLIVTFYFLKFRNILPLTIIHAIVFVLSRNWVEVNL